MRLCTDIFIAGGGPAGSTAAIAAHNHGKRAVIAERKKFPRDKVCGDGIALSLKKAWLELKIDPDLVFRSADSVQADLIRIFDSRGNKIELTNDLFITRKRIHLDAFLWRQIDPAVIKLEETEITLIEKNEKGKYLIYTKTGTQETVIEATYIIGADGYSSYIKRKFFSQLQFRTRVASRAYVTIQEPAVSAYDFHFEDQIAPGYFWCFRTGNNEFNTGVYMDQGNDLDIHELHAFFIKKYLKMTVDKSHISTWPIPNNTSFEGLADDNILLAGDAAGLCDPLFGHGIDAAILSSLAAIRSIEYHSSANCRHAFSEIYRHHLSLSFGDSFLLSQNAYHSLSLKEDSTLNILNSFIHEAFY